MSPEFYHFLVANAGSFVGTLIGLYAGEWLGRRRRRKQMQRIKDDWDKMYEGIQKGDQPQVHIL